MVASFLAWASYAAGSAHVPRGDSTAEGTSGTEVGTSNPNTGSLVNLTFSIEPESAARSMALVCVSFILVPVPYGPPVHPVFTSQTFALCREIRSPSIREYTP